MMFFLLMIWDFVFILGLFYTLLIFWIAFIGIQLMEDVVVLKRTKFFGVPLGLVFTTSLPGSATPVGYLWAL